MPRARGRASAICLLLAIQLLSSPPVRGQARMHRGVRAVKNPFAMAIQFPVEFDLARPIGQFSRVQDVIGVQPVVPFLLGPKWDLITQTSLAVVSQPDLSHHRQRTWGVADITTGLYFSPERKGKVQWGAGPVFLFPSATSPLIGAGKWGAGPASAVFLDVNDWVFGLVVNDVRSFAGDSRRQTVHYSTFQYQASHNFWRGWYLTTSPPIAVDWTAPPGERWVVPVGLGVGNVFSLDHRHFGAEFSSYYSLVHPKTQPYAKWVFSLQLSFAKSIRP